MLLAFLAVLALVGALPATSRAQGAPPFRVPETWVRNRPLIERFDVLDRAGRAAEGFAYLDSLISAARARDERVLLVQALLKRGGTRAYRRDRARGVPDLVEAVRVAQALRDTLGQLEALRWHAYSLDEANLHPRATPLWRRMRDLARAWGSPSHEGWARLGLAQGALEGGRPREARAEYQRARAAFQGAGDRFGTRQSGVGLQRVLRHLNDVDGSVALATELVAESRSAGDRLTQAQLLNNLGALEIERGDPMQALRRLRESVALYRDLERDRGTPVPMTAIANLAQSLARLGRIEEGCELLESWLESRRDRDRSAWTLLVYELASLRLQQGRPNEAERLMRDALAAADTTDRATRWQLMARLGQALAQRGQSREAIVLMQTEVDRGGASAWQWSALRSELARVLVLSGRVEDGLRLVEELSPATPPDAHRHEQWRANMLRAWGDVGRARWSEAAARMDGLTRGLLARRARGRDFESRESHAEDARELRALVTAVALRGGGPMPPARAEWAFDRLQPLKAVTLDERLRAPGRPDTLSAQRPATAARLRAGVLRADEVLFDIHEVAEGSLVLTLTRERVTAHWIGGGSVLAERAERLRGVLRSGTPEAAAAACRALGRLVFAEAAPLLARQRRVLWSGDATLLPIAALHSGENSGPLGLSHAIGLVPSATVLARLRTRDAVAGPPLVALAGNEDGRGRRLDGARSEVRWLQGWFEGVRTPEARDGGAALRALRTAGLIHLAAHAETDDDNPWGSGMLLGDRERPEGWLRAAQVAATRLPGRLAVLSGCRSIGSSRPGEGALGLSAAFLAAGVPSTLATLWDVEDEITAECMRVFYRRLAQGLPVGDALRAAQVELASRPATAHPRVWAAFTLVGLPETRVTLRRTLASRVLP